MRFSSTITIALASAVASAAPVRKQVDPTNLLVLQFADVLEQLESQFYSQALQKFQATDFTDAGFSSAQIPMEQFISIASDESTHSTVLQGEIISLGAKPITSCKFDFSKVLRDVTTMSNVARLVENTGVSAYLGAANLISDPRLLTAAASILTVEARHQTVLNILNSGTAIPQAFDVALTPSEVLAIAGPFISGCDVGVKANPSLSVTNTGPVEAGTSLTFSSTAINGSTDRFSCQMLAGGLSFSISLPFSQCVVPDGVTGPVILWITSDAQPLANSVVDRAQNNIIAGPTMFFLDNRPQLLGQIVRAPASGSGSSPPATSTTTITPGQASSILSGAVPSLTGSVLASPSPSGVPSVLQNNGGPNLYVGPSPDGKTMVTGWSNVTNTRTIS